MKFYVNDRVYVTNLPSHVSQDLVGRVGTVVDVLMGKKVDASDASYLVVLDGDYEDQERMFYGRELAAVEM